MSDLLKTNFLSSPSACAKLADHIHQASDIGTFSSLSSKKQKEAAKVFGVKLVKFGISRNLILNFWSLF